MILAAAQLQLWAEPQQSSTQLQQRPSLSSKMVGDFHRVDLLSFHSRADRTFNTSSARTERAVLYINYKLQLRLRPNTPRAQRRIEVSHCFLNSSRRSRPPCHRRPLRASRSVLFHRVAARRVKRGGGGTQGSSIQPLSNSYKDHSCAHTCCRYRRSLYCYHSSSGRRARHSC